MTSNSQTAMKSKREMSLAFVKKFESILREASEDISLEILKRWLKHHKIEFFNSDEHHYCYQLFDKEKHLIVKLSSSLRQRFSRPSKPTLYLLVPKKWAEKALVLGLPSFYKPETI